MAYKTFISYKYSDSVDARDRIIQALGADVKYYKGEDGYSDDMSSFKAITIKKKLSDMIFDTSITILILSEHMTESKWIDWEIGYSLRKETRNGRQSQPNIIIPVIETYDYFGLNNNKINSIEEYLGIKLPTKQYIKTVDEFTHELKYRDLESFIRAHKECIIQ